MRQAEENPLDCFQSHSTTLPPVSQSTRTKPTVSEGDNTVSRNFYETQGFPMCSTTDSVTPTLSRRAPLVGSVSDDRCRHRQLNPTRSSGPPYEPPCREEDSQGFSQEDSQGEPRGSSSGFPRHSGFAVGSPQLNFYHRAGTVFVHANLH